MSQLESDLAKFYDQQAPRRAKMRPDERRDGARSDFVALLQSEGRSSVLEIGTGTGRDSAALQAAGLAVTGIDLSSENVRHCRELGIDYHQGSLFEMPFEDGAFEAGWTMSTLLHVPNDQIDDALRRVAGVLAPGAPIAIGVLGGRDSEETLEEDRFEPKRFFSHRSDGTLRRILERFGTIERFETWPAPTRDDEHYQYCVLRTLS
jgi:SAM-dependent methyltransferase